MRILTGFLLILMFGLIGGLARSIFGLARSTNAQRQIVAAITLLSLVIVGMFVNMCFTAGYGNDFAFWIAGVALFATGWKIERGRLQRLTRR